MLWCFVDCGSVSPCPKYLLSYTWWGGDSQGKVLYSWQHLWSHWDGALGTEGRIETASRVQGFTGRPVANEMDASLRLT